MCQAYEGEASYLRWSERQQIKEKWRKHKSGEAPLSDDEIKRLVVQKMMLDEN